MSDHPIDDVPPRGEMGFWQRLREEEKAREAADRELHNEIQAAQLRIESQIADGLTSLPRSVAKLTDLTTQLLATAHDMRVIVGRGWLWNGVLLVAFAIGLGGLGFTTVHHWVQSHPGTALRLGRLEERTLSIKQTVDDRTDRIATIDARVTRLERIDAAEEVIGHRPGSPTMPPASATRPAGRKPPTPDAAIEKVQPR